LWETVFDRLRQPGKRDEFRKNGELNSPGTQGAFAAGILYVMAENMGGEQTA